MSPLYLNLLSPRKKAQLKNLVRFLLVKELLELVVFTCSILAITHLFGWLVLTSTIGDLAQAALLVQRDAPPYNQDVRIINTLIKNIASASDEYAVLTPRIIDLVSTLPADIKLNTLTINRADRTLVLSGVAETRSALLNYNTVLSSLTWAEAVSAPRSQILQKENINFEIRASLKGFINLKNKGSAGTKASR